MHLKDPWVGEAVKLLLAQYSRSQGGASWGLGIPPPLSFCSHQQHCRHEGLRALADVIQAFYIWKHFGGNVATLRKSLTRSL